MPNGRKYLWPYENSYPKPPILHIRLHSCETVPRVSGVTLGVLRVGNEPPAARNVISLLLGLPHKKGRLILYQPQWDEAQWPMGCD
jgi:hypothetical protein